MEGEIRRIQGIIAEFESQVTQEVRYARETEKNAALYALKGPGSNVKLPTVYIRDKLLSFHKSIAKVLEQCDTIRELLGKPQPSVVNGTCESNCSVLFTILAFLSSLKEQYDAIFTLSMNAARMHSELAVMKDQYKALLRAIGKDLDFDPFLSREQQIPTAVSGPHNALYLPLSSTSAPLALPAPASAPTASSSPFPSFAASSTPSFGLGSTGLGSSGSGFGISGSGFGSGSTAFSFGTSSSPALGAGSTGFGLGGSSAPVFGSASSGFSLGSSAAAFGASSSSGIGGFGASSTGSGPAFSFGTGGLGTATTGGNAFGLGAPASGSTSFVFGAQNPSGTAFTPSSGSASSFPSGNTFGQPGGIPSTFK